MGVIINGKELESMTHDGVEVQTWTHNGAEVYSAGKMVTYMVDSGISYQEKVKKGHSCLSPTTFTPSKSGWTFVGWREDDTASGSVLGSKVMERSPITLYAVFKQTITLSYNGNGATSGSTASQSGTRYYNNENVNNPSFALRSNGFERTYYNFQKWALNSASGTQYSVGDSITLSGNATMYAVWSASVSYKEVSKNVTTALNNWQAVRTLVPYGVVFRDNPAVSISGDNEQRVMHVAKTYAIVTSAHSQGGGTWNVTVKATGYAYDSANASGIGNDTGTIPVSINNWNGGSANIRFKKTFKSPPTMNWYSPNPSSSAIANDWNISFKNITTTGCTISWSKSTGSESKTLGWIAEGNV